MLKNRVVSSLIKYALLTILLILNNVANAQVALNLTTGWNLLGNSSTSPIDVTSTFGDPTKITTVWKWNSTASKWSFYAPSMATADLVTYATNKGYDVLTTINSKDGFWVNASSTSGLIGPAAIGVSLIESDLQQGWNLKGSADNLTPSLLNQGLNCSLNAAGKSIVTTWSWDATNSNWKFYAPSLEAQGGTVLTDYITQKNYEPFNAALSASDGFWLNIGSAIAGSAACQNTAPTFAGMALVIANDTSTVTAAWLDALDDTTPPSQIKYNIYVSTDPMFTPSDATLNQSLIGQKQAVITGLTAGTTYYIQGVAIDMQGLTSAITEVPTSVATLTDPVVLSASTPLARAADLNLVSPTLVGTDYYFPFTGFETPPAVGSILIGSNPDGTGYLTKVTSASVIGTDLVVQTTQGALSNAVLEGEINTSLKLFNNAAASASTSATLSGLKAMSIAAASTPTRLEWSNNLLTFEESTGANLPSGISVLRNPNTGRYTISASQANVVGASSTIQPLAVTGSSSEALSFDVAVSFTPKLETSLKWTTGPAGVALQKGKLMASGTLTIDANAIYNFNASATFTKDVTFDVFKRTYTSMYFVGAVPVYQQITFTLGAHLEANATAAVKANANANFSETVAFGVQYNAATQAWETIAPTTSNTSALTATLNANGGVTSQLRLIPNVEVKFYTAAAANLSVEPVLLGNIQASAIANANFLTGYFPPGITQLTSFDASLNAQCFVGANLQFLGATIPTLSKTQVCDIPVANFFSLPTLALTSKAQANATNLLTATITDGVNDPFSDGSIKWTVYPADAGTISPGAGQPRQALFAFNTGKTSATIFFSGYGRLGELGRQFAQIVVTDPNAIILTMAINPANPSVAPGKTVQLIPSVTDQNGNPAATPVNLLWSSDNADITVNSNGLVTAKSTAIGSAVITVSDPSSQLNVTTTVTIVCTATNFVTQGGLTWTPDNCGGGATYAAYYPGTHMFNWLEASAFCAGDIFQGQSGWRLPTKDELIAFYNSGLMKGEGLPAGYWSSTLYDPQTHWFVAEQYSAIFIHFAFDISHQYVRCVHAP
jgi:hypothetical protein